MGKLVKDWVPGSEPDGSDPPRVTPAARIVIIISAVFLVVAIVVGIINLLV
jgi:hypothetical protein